MIEIREVVSEDIDRILPLIRAHEQKTIERLGLNALALLEDTFERGRPMCIAEVDGEPMAMWGLEWQTVLSTPVLWMLTTDLVDRYPIGFLRESRRVVHEWREIYGPVEGLVDSDFDTSLRWLRWIGFREIDGGNYIRMRYS